MSAAERLLSQDSDEKAETRLLRVPALNFEALWVISPDGESRVLPIFGAG